MAGQRRSATTDDVHEQLPPVQPTADQGPDEPSELDRRSWWAVLRRVLREYRRDNLSDWAAALTYYAILSLFPGQLLLVYGWPLLGRSAVNTVIDNHCHVDSVTDDTVVKKMGRA